MKTLLISFLFLSALMPMNSTQETEKMSATFESYEDGVYYFIDKDGYSNGFHHIEEEASKAYDLTTKNFIGKKFLITYTNETEMDDLNEEINVNTILVLKLIE
jgi:hypothetical protein